MITLLLWTTGPDRLARRAAGVAAACAGDDVEVVPVEDRGGPRPGVALNAGLARCRGTYVVVIDGGLAVTRAYLAEAVEAMQEDARVAAVIGRGSFAIGEPADPTRQATMRNLVASPWHLARTGVYRRSALELAGGFDAELPALLEWELRIRLASAGQVVAVKADGPAALDARDDITLREALRPERYLPSIRRVIGLHASAFVDNLQATIGDRVRLNDRLWTAQAERLERRDRLRSSLRTADDHLATVRRDLRAMGQATVDWAALRRTSPVSRLWGLDRGRPLDRHYIEGFVSSHASDISGVVLELLDSHLTTRFGRNVARADVLDVDPGNHLATRVGDLRHATTLPAESYDCVILTQTLHLIDDMTLALQRVHDALVPGGVLLATVPTASMFASEYGPGGDHWRLTPAGARWLFERVFEGGHVEVSGFGNVLTTTASLMGLAAEEVEPRELDEHDPDYPTIVAIRAVKAPRRTATAAARPDARILLYHRVATLGSDPFALAVTPDHLRAHLDLLKRDWDLWPLPDLAARAIGGDLPDRAVALTFDDGYLDNLTTVLPVLQEFDIPATFFVTSEGMDRERRFWWDELAAMLASGKADVRIDLADRTVRGDLNSPAGVERACAELHDLLKTASVAVRDHVVWQLRSQHGREPSHDVAGRPMTATELVSLARAHLATIGGHSVHHISLNALDPMECHRETSQSRTALERLIGRPVTGFAYPFGDASAAAERAVAQAGYVFAVTCDQRRLRPFERALALPRLQVPDVDARGFRDWLNST